jgi:hypothetical protein
LRIDHQALRPRLDQAGAELREIEDARHQRDEAGQIQRNDAAGEAREREREEELPGAAQPAKRLPPALLQRLVVGNAILIEALRSILVVQALVRLRSI